MNKLLYTFFLALITLPYTQAQGIKFKKGDVKSLMQKAQKKKKLLFIDTYASWCKPCKMMEKDIFPLKEVGSYYNKQFICSKIDMESPQGEEFSTKHKVESIPTFYYKTGTGEIIFKKVGGTDNPTKFIEYGQAAQDIYNLKTKQEKISNPKSMLHYAYFLKEADDSSYNNYLHQFLDTQQDWSSAENMKVILDLAEQEESPALEYFVENFDSFSNKLGAEATSEKRLLLVLDRSIEFLKATPEGAMPDMDKLAPVFEKYFGKKDYLEHFLLFQFRYHQQDEDYPNMRLVLRRFINEVIVPMEDGREKAIEYINTAAVYYEAAKNIAQFQAEAIQWGERAIEMDQSADIYSILAVLCENAGFMEKATLYQQKANEAHKK